MSLHHQELEDFKIAGAATIYMFMPLINTTNFSIGSQLKEMLKSELRRLNTVKRSSFAWKSEQSQIFKKVFLMLNVKMRKLLKLVRVSKGTAVKWAAGIIKRVKFYAFCT